MKISAKQNGMQRRRRFISLMSLFTSGMPLNYSGWLLVFLGDLLIKWAETISLECLQLILLKVGEQEEQDVERALASFEKLGKVPSSVMEARCVVSVHHAILHWKHCRRKYISIFVIIYLLFFLQHIQKTLLFWKIPASVVKI